MRVPRLPDGLIYAAVVVGLLWLAHGRREREDAPSAPPTPPGLAQTPIDPASPFAADRVSPVNRFAETASGTAFSVGGQGLWLTARHVIDACGQVGVVVAEGRGVAARVVARQGDLALLSTEGGAPALPLAAPASLRLGEQLFHPGFPQGGAGEVASRLMGRESLAQRGRGAAPQSVITLVEDGRTEGLKGALAGLSGAPVLDGDGAVVGVTLAQAPRRGRLYAATPQAVSRILTTAHAPPAPAAAGAAFTADNYGRAADELRRDLRVVQVVCLAR